MFSLRRARLLVLTAGALLAAPAASASASTLNSTTIVAAPDGSTSVLAEPGHGTLGYGRQLSTDGSRALFLGDPAAGGSGLGLTTLETALNQSPTLTFAYVRNRSAGTTTLASRADGASGAPVSVGTASISADGNYVAFTSTDAAVVAGVTQDPNNVITHVYVRDIAGGHTYLVDQNPTTHVPSPEGGAFPSVAVSGGDLRVAFQSDDRQLASGVTTATPGKTQIYVHAIPLSNPSGAFGFLVSAPDGSNSTGGDGDSEHPAISSDGNFVAFDSTAQNLKVSGIVPAQIYLRQISTSGITLVSQRTTDNSVPGNAASTYPAINGDGTRIAYETDATNLGTSDGNGRTDVVLWLGTTNVYQSINGGTLGDGDSTDASISDDGSYVAFLSNAKNLVSGISSESTNIRHVLLKPNGASVVLLDRLEGLAGTVGDGSAVSFSSNAVVGLSNNGTFATVATEAPNIAGALGAASDDTQTFGRTVASGHDEPISSAASAPAGLGRSIVRPFGGSVSDGGRFVVFSSTATGFVPGVPAGATVTFRRDTATNATTIVSRADGAAGAVAADSGSGATVSADGRYVAFISNSPTLGVSSGGNSDAFVRDTQTGHTTRLTTDAGTQDAQISGDGSQVLVTTSTSLVSADTNNRTDAYVIPSGGGTPVLASRHTGAAGIANSDSVQYAAIDADGGRVLYTYNGTDTTPANPSGYQHVYVRDLAAGTTTLVDRASGASGAPANADTYFAGISGDGTKVAFQSAATNLPGALGDLMIRDLGGATTKSVLSMDGVQQFFFVQLDRTGTRVGFGAQPAIGGDPLEQVYTADVATGTPTLASRADGANGAAASASVFGFGISPDGGCVAFNTPGDGLTGTQPTGKAYYRVWLRAVTSDCPVVAGSGGGSSGGTGGGSGSGSGTGGSGGGGTTPAKDTTAPVISALKLSKKTFTVQKTATATTGAATRAAKKKKAKKKVAPATTISYTLSEAATVKLTFLLSKPGKRKGKACVAPSKKLKKAKSCTRLTSVATLTRTSKQGANKVPFTGRIGKKALKSGSYVLQVVATDAAGNRSGVKAATLRVKAAKKAKKK